MNELKNKAKQVAAFFPSRFSVKDQAFFVKRLSFLINANIPILESLHMLRTQGRSPAFARIITLVIDDVSEGKQLSKSLSRFPDMFGTFAINLIKVGESSGILSQNLDYLADELKKRQVLRRKTIGALVYPALITVATLAIVAFLMVYLFPKIMPVFLSLHMKLPLSTRVVMAVSVFLQHWGFLVVVLSVLIGIVFSVALNKSTQFCFWVDRLLLRLPVVGEMIKAYNLANAGRTLGLLLKSGITLSTALVIVAETTPNPIYKKEWVMMSEAATRGAHLSLHLAHTPKLFPDIFAQMVAVGERTGNLANTLVYLSEFYEHEMDDFTKSLSSLIEPSLMLCMGLFVGFIAISIITPIYGITQNLHP
ncbi:MAG: type II secretion system F family protein [bacterium]